MFQSYKQQLKKIIFRDGCISVYLFAVIVMPLSKVNFPITIPLLLIYFNENQSMKFHRIADTDKFRNFSNIHST